MAAAMGMRTGMGMGMRMGMGGAMSMGTGMGGAMAMRGRAVRAGRRAVVAALALVVSYQLLHIFAVLDSYSERYADGDTQEATASIGKDAQGTAAAIIGSTANVPLPRLGGARNAKRMQELDTVEPRVAALVLAESTSAATTSLNLNLAVQVLVAPSDFASL